MWFSDTRHDSGQNVVDSRDVVLTIENTDLKVHTLHYASDLLTCQTLISKTFANSLNMQKQYEKNVWEKTNDDKITDHDKPHFDLFLPQYQRQRKCFFQSAS